MKIDLRLRWVISTLLFACSGNVHAFAPDLDAVIAQVRGNKASGKKSILVMDLDETVVDSHLRKYLAYRKASEELCGTAAATITSPMSSDCEKALGLALHDIYGSTNGYSQPELMTKLGITDATLVRNLFDLRRRYEGGPEFFHSDTLMPGASAFIRAVKLAGADIYFVSSRGEAEVGAATFEQLIRLGVLMASETPFVILRQVGQDSVTFKRESAERIRVIAESGGHQVVALFENEPSNLMAWARVFAGAKSFFVTGSFVTPGPLPVGTVSMTNYR